MGQQEQWTVNFDLQETSTTVVSWVCNQSAIGKPPTNLKLPATFAHGLGLSKPPFTVVRDSNQ